MKKFIILLTSASLSFSLLAQTAIKTSFESADGYTQGNISGKRSWTGNGSVTNSSDYAKTGGQGLQLSSNSSALQLDHIAYAKNATGLTSDVYLDIWVKVKALGGTFSITAYDLTPNSSSKRTLMIDLLAGDKIKIYSGSSGSSDETFSVNNWSRISAKIDYATGTYQIAINGTLVSKTYNFRETYNPVDLNRPNGDMEYHSLRFSNGSTTNDIAIDDIYVGTEPISDISFRASSATRKVNVAQPEKGSITLSPTKSEYELNDQVSANISVPNHYKFTGWTGDLSGTENPKSFTVTKNMNIGAMVEVDPNNPPPQYSISVNQPSTGGSITIEPQQGSYNEGTSVRVTIATNIGYEFIGWAGDLSGTDNPKTFIISGNMNIGANVLEKTETGTIKEVNTVANLKTALNNMAPGDEIIVEDGDYNLGGISLTTLGGTPFKPVIVRAKNIGGVRFTGKTTFTLRTCENIIFKGFKFDLEHVSTIFKLEGSSRIRITQNEFKMAINGDNTSKWIIIGDVWQSETCRSMHNRIDHNLFDGKYDGGSWVVIDGSHGTIPEISKHDTIDHNHFRNNKPRVDNEKETIRMGVSDLCQKSAYTVVEHNLFEECDGDPEVVSVKSCHNIVRYNTFLRSQGTLSLRHGDNNTAEGNYFLGDGKMVDGNGCGGIRVYGLNQTIVNNYFEGLTGSKWDAAITITNGDVNNPSTSLSSHNIPENVMVAFNTMVNNVSNIEIGFDNNGKYGKAPKNCTIANNIVVDSLNPIVKSYSAKSLAGVKFENNIMYPTGTSSIGIEYSSSQIKIVDPMLAKTNKRIPGNDDYTLPFETYKLSEGSPAIDASVGTYSPLLDREGQKRIGKTDIGADEYNTNDSIIYGVLGIDHIGVYGSRVSYEGYTGTGNPGKPGDPNNPSAGMSSSKNQNVLVYPNPAAEFTNIQSEKEI
ncbi:MAG: hypothetical protein LBH34_04345, partial [Prevotellaceae bacterium]|nr:hypothetical protein [Prevotellaceae bacterium]